MNDLLAVGPRCGRHVLGSLLRDAGCFLDLAEACRLKVCLVITRRAHGLRTLVFNIQDYRTVQLDTGS
jgi:hypothetical protein